MLEYLKCIWNWINNFPLIKLGNEEKSLKVKQSGEGNTASVTNIKIGNLNLNSYRDINKQVENIKNNNVESISQKIQEQNLTENERPSQEWALRYFQYAKGVSSDDAQRLWAEVFCRESRNNRSISFRTLEILRILDKDTAQLFEKFCSMCVKFTGGTGKSIMLPLFGRGSGDKDLSPYGLTMRDTYLLGESGLIHTTKIIFTSGADSESWSFPLEFQRKKWGLKPEKYSEKQEIEIRGLELTESGKELFEIVSKTTDTNFENFVKDEFLSQGVRMVEAVD